MTRQLLSASLAALLVSGGLATAQAQQNQQGQGGPGTMMQQDRQVDRPEGTQARGDQNRRGGRDGMRGRGYRHGMMHHRMGRGGMHGMRGHHGMMRGQMMRTMIILMDTDGDGELSLDEVQAVTERFFNAMDADDNGNLSMEEIRGFYGPGRMGMGGQAGADDGLGDDTETDDGLGADDNNGTDDDNGETAPGQAQ